MILLSIDSSSKTASVCVTRGEQVICEINLDNAMTHSQTLLPMIDHALSLVGLSPDDIDAFAITNGPGSFTGIRIGAATVKGLAMNGKPIIAVPTLLALAQGGIPPAPSGHPLFLASAEASFCGKQGGTPGTARKILICPAMDARRNQVYNALFRVKDGILVRLCDDRAIAAEDLVAELAKDYPNYIIILCGDGAKLVYAAAGGIVQTIYDPSWDAVRASAVAMCARIGYNDVNQTDAFGLVPSYLRPSQAEREAAEKEKGQTESSAPTA